MHFTIPYVDLDINLGITCVGFLVGLVSSLFGIGGGFILVPALSLIFNYSAATAAGSSLAQMVFTTATGVISHYRKGNINWRVALTFLSGSVIGIELGAFLIEGMERTEHSVAIFGHSVPSDTFYQLVALSSVFVLLGGFIVYETHFMPRTSSGEPGRRLLSPIRFARIPPSISSNSDEFVTYSAPLLASIGIIGGIIAGFLGIGGGFLAVPIFLYVVGLPTHRAVGTSLAVVFGTALWGMYRHDAGGRANVDMNIVASVVLGAPIGAFLGVIIAHKLKAVSLRRYFAYVILTTLILIWIAFFIKLFA